MKNLPDEKKEELWILRRAEWWAERRLGRSSEDIWKAKVYVQAFGWARAVAHF